MISIPVVVMLCWQSKSKHKDHYLGDPSVTMVMTGCHALLQFIGVSAEVSESLIKSGDCHMTLYT